MTIYKVLFVKITFSFDHVDTKINVCITESTFLNVTKRLFSRNGILVLDDKKIDLTHVKDIKIEYCRENAVV